LVLAGFEAAADAEVPIFFDPGPGNPELDNSWHRTAARLATVLLATEGEAERMSGLSDPVASARALLTAEEQLVIVKRGVAGCMLVTATELEIVPGFPVEAVDATGAGDSFAAAAIFGYLNDLPLEALGTLANATGAAKVQNPGTGHSMPSAAEVRTVLERFDKAPDLLDMPL
jgi:sugar/nucleoside kinase (ribokinase family)